MRQTDAQNAPPYSARAQQESRFERPAQILGEKPEKARVMW